MDKVESVAPTTAQAKKSEGMDFIRAIRGAVLYRKMNDRKWGKSKHLGSRFYPSTNQRRAMKKAERQNRKAQR